MLSELRQRLKKPRRWPYLFVLLCCLYVSMCSCAHPHFTIKINAVPGSNANSAIAVDLVSVDNRDLSNQISKMSAADWFGGKKDEFMLTYSKPGMLIVKSREWIAGQQGIKDLTLPAHNPVKIPLLSAAEPTVFVFANYLTPGPHRAVLQPNQITTIQLGVDDLKVIVNKK